LSVVLVRVWGPLLAFVLLAAACSGETTDAPPPGETPDATSTADASDDSPRATPTPDEAYTYAQATARGPYAVGHVTLDLVDESRLTMANGDQPLRQERSIPVDVWYPAASDGEGAPADASGAPYPLIIWAHGFSSLPQLNAPLLSHLASHGYVVAGPTFPLTKLRAPGGTNFNDTFNQDEDVSFVIDEILRLSDDSASSLNSMVDGDRIGMAGHSGGSFTTLLVLYGEDRDPRIDAGLPVSASACFLEESAFDETAIPTMFIVGTADQLFTVDGLRYAYDNEGPPRYWAAVHDANHVRFSGVDLDDSVAAAVAAGIRSVGEQIKGPAPGNLLAGCATQTPPTTEPPITLEPVQELLRALATPFFAAHLQDDAGARAFLAGGIDAATGGRVTFEFEDE
jgi:predicted dienelactone hydrolase